MNAEVAELHLSAVWLQNNTTTEQLTRKYTAESESMNRQIREINKARQVLQTKAYPELSKLVHKRNLALQRKWSCQLAHEEIKQDLLGKTATLFAAYLRRLALWLMYRVYCTQCSYYFATLYIKARSNCRSRACIIWLCSARGIDAEQVLAERRAQAAMEVDLNDAAHNSTVREYETVNTSGEPTVPDATGEAEAGKEEAAGGGSAVKRARRH
jgi:hypothetical protein